MRDQKILMICMNEYRFMLHVQFLKLGWYPVKSTSWQNTRTFSFHKQNLSSVPKGRTVSAYMKPSGCYNSPLKGDVFCCRWDLRARTYIVQKTYQSIIYLHATQLHERRRWHLFEKKTPTFVEFIPTGQKNCYQTVANKLRCDLSMTYNQPSDGLF